jgi:salicylate hydroxylase
MSVSMADVLIAGAGLGGLTCALAMIQRGHRVRVFEQASELREVGAGVQLGPNGSRLLISLGLRDAMEGVVALPNGREFRLWTTGQTWRAFDLADVAEEQFGAPYWTVHRGDFHAVLVDAMRRVAPDAIQIGNACVGFAQDERSATIKLANGETATGDVLIGADGVHSKIRQQMFGDGQAHFTGIMAWRGLVPMDRLPPHQRRLVGNNWIGVGGHVVTYPLRRGELLNFVAIVERDDWRTEGWTIPGTQEECLRDIARWHEDVKTIARAIDTPFKWALLGRDPLDHYAEGRVCVMGDAAHPTLPFLAQGANMALEDGIILARCMDEFNDVREGLHHYEQARLERTAAIVRGSADNTKRFHNPALGEAAGAEAYVNREFHPDKVAARYNWLYEYDALTVPL